MRKITFLILLFFLINFTLAAVIYDGSNNDLCYVDTSSIVDHQNNDWIINSNITIAGYHKNINNFKINPGVIVKIKPYDGSTCGTLRIDAVNFDIAGVLDATAAGYGGGGGGGGGGGRTNQSPSAFRGAGGAGTAGGNNGTGGGITHDAGAGGKGGGAYGGNGGSGTITSPYYYAPVGNNGGYRGVGVNGEVSSSLLTENIWMGSAGGGGAGGRGGNALNGTRGGGAGGGGAGNPGGGAIKLVASESFILQSTGKILAKGVDNITGNGSKGGNATNSYAGLGGAGGSANINGSSSGGGRGEPNPSYNSCYDSGQRWPLTVTTYADCFPGIPGGDGGNGAGGGILIKSELIKIFGEINNTGGSGTTNGGTLKLFCQNHLPNLTGSTINSGNFFEYKCVDLVEICNGVDDDLDGQTDEGLICPQNCVTKNWMGSEYLFCLNKKSWSDASTSCISNDYNLVTINNEAENNWLYNEAILIENQPWWIGFNDLAVEGSFEWVFDNSTYTNWRVSQPTPGIDTEDCTRINTQWDNNNTWTDSDCALTQNYICEKKIDEVCDGVDNDLDGIKDNGFECELGSIGCDASCNLIPEVCNGIDDDGDGWVDVVCDQFNDNDINLDKWEVNLGQNNAAVITEENGKLRFITAAENMLGYVSNKELIPKSNKLRLKTNLGYSKVDQQGAGLVLTNACNNVLFQEWQDTSDISGRAIYLRDQENIYSTTPILDSYDYNFLLIGNNIFGNIDQLNLSFNETSDCMSSSINPKLIFGNQGNDLDASDVDWTIDKWTLPEIDYLIVECKVEPEVEDGWDNDCDGEVDEGYCNPEIENCGDAIIGQSCPNCSILRELINIDVASSQINDNNIIVDFGVTCDASSFTKNDVNVYFEKVLKNNELVSASYDKEFIECNQTEQNLEVTIDSIEQGNYLFEFSYSYEDQNCPLVECSKKNITYAISESSSSGGNNEEVNVPENNLFVLILLISFIVLIIKREK